MFQSLYYIVGLHQQKGEDGVVEYIKSTLPSVLEGIEKN